MLFIAILLPLFSFSIEGSLTIQMISLGIFILAGLHAKLKSTRGRRNFGMDAATLIICFFIPATSLLAITISRRIDLIPQTIAFMFCGISARVLITVFGIEKLLKIFVFASCALAITLFTLEFHSLIESLQLTLTASGIRMRFSPLNSHPNLIGHIFGVSFFCCSVYVLWHNKNRKKLWYVSLTSSVISLLIIGATSSRGALVALLCGAISIYISHFLQNKNIHKKIINNIIILSIVLTTITFVNYSSILEYFSDLFEANSDYRGIDSGMSGRTDNWPFIILMSLKTISGIITGHGIRSWDDNKFEMATDSSYVNLLWESGVFLTIAVISLFGHKIYVSARSKRTFESDLVLSIMVFAFVESIVARYLLSIGNSASLIILIIALTPTTYYSTKK